MTDEQTTPGVHLIMGGVGAGKTTFAVALAGRLGAVNLAVDALMRDLFHPDAPAAPDGPGFDWFMPRVLRCEGLAVALAAQIVPLGRDIVLDFGFLGREQRDRIRMACAERHLPVRLHWVDVPADERWRRVTERNEQKGETYAMDVTRDMFDFCEGLLEAPDADEAAEVA